MAKKNRSKRVKLGDLFEIPVKGGYAYAQVTQYHAAPPNYGYLVHVLPGIVRKRPDDLAAMIVLPDQFAVFSPIDAAMKRGQVEFLGNFEIPEARRQFPTFKSGTADTDGKVHCWWLWNGEDSWPIGRLSDEQKRLPFACCVNHVFLVEQIEAGYTPLTDVDTYGEGKPLPERVVQKFADVIRKHAPHLLENS